MNDSNRKKLGVDAGEVGVNVRWYSRVGEGSDIRTGCNKLAYVVSEFPPCIQYRYSLLHCNFNAYITQMEAKESMVRYSRRMRLGKEKYKGRKNYMTTVADADRERQKESWEVLVESYKMAEGLLDQRLTL